MDEKQAEKQARRDNILDVVFGNAQELMDRTQSTSGRIGEAGERERVHLVAASHLGSATEELLHLTVKAVRINPVFMRVQNFYLDTTLEGFAQAAPGEECLAVSEELLALAKDCRARADEQYAAATGAGPEPLEGADSLVRALLPTVEGTHSQLSARLCAYKAPVPPSLRQIALVQVVQRLLKQAHFALEITHGRNPLEVPSAEQFERLYEEAVADSDILAVTMIMSLQSVSAEQFHEILQQSMKLDTAATQFGYLTAAQGFLELAEQALKALESIG